MKLIVGLGNPGKEYEGTRHNVGFMTLDKLAVHMANGAWRMDKKFNSEVLKGDGVFLVKPQTYMNASGEAVKKLMAYGKWRVEDLYVVHDDLDIRLGEYKIQFGKGPKVHNGVNSVEKELGEDQFWRVRVGIDNRNQESHSAGSVQAGIRNQGQEYVLSKFSVDERRLINGIVDRVVKDLMEQL